MLRWLKCRKEKKFERRREKHRRILNDLKSKGISGSISDYGFNQNCEIYKSHDYEEIDELFTPQFSKMVGVDFRNKSEQPPELPERTHSNIRSASVSVYRDISTEERFRERTVSLPCFDNKRNQFACYEDIDDEPFYNDPWDCKSNFSASSEIQECQSDNRETKEQRLYDYLNERRKKLQCRGIRVSDESNIYSEISNSGTDSEFDSVSQSGSEFSVFCNESEEQSTQNYREPPTDSLQTLFSGYSFVSDSDASSGFCDDKYIYDTDEDNKHTKPSTLSQYSISLPSLLRNSSTEFNTLLRSPSAKIDEDSELYLIPKRYKSMTETRIDILELPIQRKKGSRTELRRLGNIKRRRT